MKCPYCAEDIKDEAIVCPQCRRDLTFFKPLDKRLQAIDSELAALTECVSKISAHLDRQRADGNENPEAKAPVVKLKKPTVWQMLLMVLLQFLLTIVLLVGLVALSADLRPVYGRLEVTGDDLKQRLVMERRVLEDNLQKNEEFDRRRSVLLKIFIPALFVLPIALGLWIGLRWQGTNLKRYLLVGLLCGSVDGAIILTMVIITVQSHGHTQGDFSFAALFILIDLFRCIFGFATGGLLGDWLERRRYPELYGRGFSDLVAPMPSNRGERVGHFGRMTQGLGSLTSSVAPLVPLIGLIITSVFGFYAAQEAAKKSEAAKKAAENEKSAVSRPADNTPAPSPQPSAR
jgi:hypothetical protein